MVILLNFSLWMLNPFLSFGLPVAEGKLFILLVTGIFTGNLIMQKLAITPIDKKAEQDGVWTSYCGVRLKIARANNPAFTKAFRANLQPHQYEFDKGILDDEIAKRIMCESTAGTVLVDWDEKTFPGNIKFSKENAVSLLMNDQDCLDFVIEFSQNIENFLKREEEKVVKES